ncbi:cyclic nucleotide-binding domain-containing protein [Golovinomyces cichoracearum]|uniref:Cyclic nucleotide-binding domain-containing protein n=1 Tax=Golovinomyces cichoracearum TaxID=62708 RepID=A0A420H865_9PEZI|nr:cyclic nucleotide-binding domain-containing protein [Golovinomyces cichoracearum]
MRRNRTLGLRSHGASIPNAVSLIRSFNIETNPARPVRPSPLTASTIPDMPLDLVDRIRSFPLFLSAPDTFLAAIGKHLRPQVHPPHDHILTEGDEAKAMYWLVRGAVAVISRDGEATYAELKPGAFFGEIGILMDVPRTATIIARTKCLLLVLKKEDLKAELPKFPDMEKAIIEEAQERLTILNKKRLESGFGPKLISTLPSRGKAREAVPGEVSTGDVGVIERGLVINTKKRKSPSFQAIEDPAAGSALGSGLVNVRKTLKELPLFSNLPGEILHILGLNAQPKTYSPFTDIILQGSLGNEIYFIVRGEAEVIHESDDKNANKGSYIRPRLKQGQYFGEVTSLSLAPKRTATVRAITTVECLMIGGEFLEELWKCSSPDIRRQVETTAMTRIGRPNEDICMSEVEETINKNACPSSPDTPAKGTSLPKVDLAPWNSPTCQKPSQTDEKETMEPLDPDPFLSVDIDNMKLRSRRGSWAPLAVENTKLEKNQMVQSRSQNPITSKLVHSTTPIDLKFRPKRPKTGKCQEFRGSLPDGILIMIFSHLDIYQLMRLRQVSTRWSTLLTSSPLLCHTLDLSLFNRHVTNTLITNFIIPFVGKRVREVDISNCYHITDEGFAALSAHCGSNIKIWKMKSVWDISANAILEMSNNSRFLEEIDLSNCRKVSDNLLARIVGWVVSEPAPTLPSQSKHPKFASLSRRGLLSQSPPVGTVLGCPNLKKLTLSYCKHVTDRSMAHIAVHAHNRLESINLTRCTTITDAGFQHWSMYRFEKLRKLVLADCTYLTDSAVVYLCNSARGLRELDLSFCCALSDTATEVLSLGCPHLSILKLSFCGSAVSDSSLRSIGLHLLELKQLSVRGCVRVTGVGVEAVVEGCGMLELFDVSQCKNLQRWLENGGEEQARKRWRSTDGGKPLFETQKGNGDFPGMVLR